MGIFDKKSTTSQTINDYTTTKNTGISGDGNSSLTDSNYLNNSKSYVTMTDGGATKAAIDANEKLASNAIDASTWAAAQVVGAGVELGKSSFDLAGDISKGSNDLAKYYGALLNDSQSQVLAFTAKEAGGNRAFLDAANDRSLGAYESANRSILSLSKDTTGAISKAYSDANYQVSSIAESSLDNYAYLFGKSNEQITNANVQAQAASTKALDYVFESTKDATERNTETYIKYATYAAVAVAGVSLIAMVMGRK